MPHHKEQHQRNVAFSVTYAETILTQDKAIGA